MTKAESSVGHVQAGETVAVALSGGVDSSLSAALLLEAGFRVIGVTMLLHDEAEETAAQAAVVARFLGIDHHCLDCRSVFSEQVLRRCWAAYDQGRTPNPCVLCNRWLKFGHLLARSVALGASRLATGHHARLLRQADGRVRVGRGADPVKDQSYFLGLVTQDQLARALFPVGEMTKSQVRELARERGLPSATTKESQDTCLATAQAGTGREGAFAETLRLRFDAPSRRGALVDEAGRPLGRHGGVHLFTIGQRRGLGVARGRGPTCRPFGPTRERWCWRGSPPRCGLGSCGQRA